jgi:molybdate transport system substrate-binding protein
VKVEFSFAGSQVLRTQLEQGAVADIFASADHQNMDLLISEKLVVLNSIQDIMTNRMIVILPPGNPAGIDELQDLTRPNLKLVLADSSVPAGSYARQVLINLGNDPAFGVNYSSSVLANVVSNETDVRQVVRKVELGEADAGFVYASDAIAAPELLTNTIPDRFNVTARYPVAIMANSTNPELAQAFIVFIKSTVGQKIISKWGFTPGQ